MLVVNVAQVRMFVVTAVANLVNSVLVVNAVKVVRFVEILVVGMGHARMDNVNESLFISVCKIR